MIALSKIIELLLTYKYLIIFPIAILEGPIVAIIAGFLATGGFLNVYYVFWLVLAGDIVGDALYYSIGRFGGRPFIARWGHYIGLNHERIMRVQEHFRKHPIKTLVFGKTQSWGSIILTAAGLTRMYFPTFVWINLVSSIPKSLIFIGIGYYFGRVYDTLTLQRYLDIGGIVLLIVGFVIIYYFFRKQQREPMD